MQDTTITLMATVQSLNVQELVSLITILFVLVVNKIKEQNEIKG